MLFLDNILHYISQIQFKIAVKFWFRKNGDTNLRVNYNLDENSLVLDVGGYKGDWTSSIFNRYKCTIFIFEPVKSFYNIISERFQDNKKIQIYNFGLGTRDTTMAISLSNDASSFHQESGTSTKEFCKIIDIDKFFLKNNLKHIDLIKINIEGGEYELVEKIIQSGLVERIENLQIQFHNFIPGAFGKRKKIQEALTNTHKLTYNYPFVWENWRKK